MKRALLFTAALALFAACSDSGDGSGAGTAVGSTVSPATTLVPGETVAPTAAPATAPPSTVPTVQGACEFANLAARAHADSVGYGTHQLDAVEQVEYFQMRSSIVLDLIAKLQAVPSADGVDVAAAVTALTDYDDWLGARVDAVIASNTPATEDDGGLLDTARAALGGTGACGDLFDLN